MCFFECDKDCHARFRSKKTTYYIFGQHCFPESPDVCNINGKKINIDNLINQSYYQLFHKIFHALTGHGHYCRWLSLFGTWWCLYRFIKNTEKAISSINIMLNIQYGYNLIESF